MQLQPSEPLKYNAYKLTLVDSELTEIERNARGASSVDDIEL